MMLRILNSYISFKDNSQTYFFQLLTKSKGYIQYNQKLHLQNQIFVAVLVLFTNSLLLSCPISPNDIDQNIFVINIKLMKETKHPLQSTRYRTPQHSEYIANHPHPVSRFSPSRTLKQEKDFYSVDQLQNILSQQISYYHDDKQQPHKLVCVCPGVDIRQNNLSEYAILKRNQYLEQKIASMKQIFTRQQQKLDRLSKYSDSHSNCQSNCFKQKYFELLRNIEPK